MTFWAQWDYNTKDSENWINQSEVYRRKNVWRSPPTLSLCHIPLHNSIEDQPFNFHLWCRQKIRSLLAQKWLRNFEVLVIPSPLTWITGLRTFIWKPWIHNPESKSTVIFWLRFDAPIQFWFGYGVVLCFDTIGRSSVGWRASWMSSFARNKSCL